MKKFVQFETSNGNEFYVEVNEPSILEPTMRGSAIAESRGVMQTAAASFEKSLSPLKEISNSIINCIKEIANSPDEIGVELGLKFNAKAGIILTSFDSEANFKISLKWKKGERGN